MATTRRNTVVTATPLAVTTKTVTLLGALFACTACVHTSDVTSEERKYKRIDYLQSVYLPMSEACRKAGGFMVFDTPVSGSTKPGRLTYTDMRSAVARGCAGT